MSAFDTLPFKNLIRERCGLVFDGGDDDKLRHALLQRSEAAGLLPEQYYPRLYGSAEEFQALVNLLTINETYFFREPEQIRLLVDRIAPRLLATRGGSGPVRILSAGCSSGEEPYSLAMALHDKYGECVGRLFEFIGGDIDSAVLEKARRGVYSEFSFRGVPEQTRQRYFSREHRHYALNVDIRRLVGFRELNLLARDQAGGLGLFDIVFFRNVSIYFDRPTRAAILSNLAGLMRDDAILVVGTAETMANDFGQFSLIEEDGLFYFAKGRPPLPTDRPEPVRAPARAEAAAAALSPVPATTATFDFASWKPPIPAAAPATDDHREALATARRMAEEKRHEEASRLVDSILESQPGEAGARLLKAHLLLDRKAFDDAETLARQVLEIDAWSVDAFLLLGMAAKWRDRPEDAIGWFRQAAYAHHECWPAHYYLGDLYRNRGELDQARRAYRVVLQLLSGGEPKTGIHHLPVGLPAGEIRFLCERRLASLGAGERAGR